MAMDSVAFKGIYKVTLPNVKNVKDEKEKAALTEAAIGTVVMGANASVVAPRVDEKKGCAYYKIDDKNDAKFEQGFNQILTECNKKFGIDLAKKVYLEKATEQEFNQAKPC